MPPPLFEVSDLRIAVFDADRAVRRIPGPTTDTGEELDHGWVEVIPPLTFSVSRGEVLALVGESASGKSLGLMGGFSLLSPGARVIGGTTTFDGVTFRPGGEPITGRSRKARKARKEAKLAGTVIADYKDDEWARAVGSGIGFIFQNPIGAWTPTKVIGEQAGEALVAHSDLSNEEIEKRVYDALGEVQLPKSRRLFGAFSTELSRGMAQRAMLAAALTRAPSLLIADEPLTGLDAPVAAAIMDLIVDLQRKRGMAMVLVTHDLAAVARLADRVAVMYGGVIIEQAPAADLYRTPRHPYTEGLIGSIPGVTTARLRSIPGEAPRLVDIDRRGCVFADRCTYAVDVCHTSQPIDRPVGASTVACHLADELTLEGVGSATSSQQDDASTVNDGPEAQGLGT